MKTNLKLSILIGSAIILGATFHSCRKQSPVTLVKSANRLVTSASEKGIPVISLCCDIASVKFNCQIGGGLCNCKVRIGGACRGDERSRSLTSYIIADQLFIESSETFPSDADFFIFDEPTLLSSDVSESLGYSQVVIQKGRYTVEHSGKSQKVRMNIQATQYKPESMLSN